MRRIDPKDLSLRPFSILNDDWALLVGGKARPNPMTVSWGGLGTLWNRSVVTVYVRPTRHTYALLEADSELTLNFLPEELRPALNVCGSASGRDIDKWSTARITPVASERIGVPRVAEARLALECRTLTTFDVDPARFLDPSILEQYPLRDFHRAFIGEVLAIFVS